MAETIGIKGPELVLKIQDLKNLAKSVDALIEKIDSSAFKDKGSSSVGPMADAVNEMDRNARLSIQYVSTLINATASWLDEVRTFYENGDGKFAEALQMYSPGA